MVCLSLLGVAFARDIADVAMNVLGGQSEDSLGYARIIAIVFLWLLDFVLNAVQASCRALIVDVPPIWQQDAANAMASSMSNVTMVFTYIIGILDLTAYLPSVGDSQFKVLCLIAIFVFLFAQSVTCLSTKEEVYERLEETSTAAHGKTLRNNTTWVSSIYYQTHPDQDSTDWTSGARAGSFALLCYAIVSVIAGVTLPTLTTHNIPRITLKNVWTFSLLVFSLTMLSTHFVKTVMGATIVLSLLGISWACIMWIPFALIGEYLNIYDSSEPTESTVPILSYGAITNAFGIEDDSVAQYTEDASGAMSSDWISCSNCEPGMVLGVLNVYVVFPQFAVALIASAIFSVVDLNEGKGFVDNNTYAGISILLQFSGLMALIATGLSSQNHEQLDLSSGADLLQHSSNDENSDSDALEDTAMGEQTSSSEDEQNEQNDNHGEDSQDQHQKESAPSTSAAISEEPQFQLTTPPQRKPLNRFDKLPIFSIEFSKFQQRM
ncbi:hypothetical protein Unana1_07919 [Umbelopsis nana]